MNKAHNISKLKINFPDFFQTTQDKQAKTKNGNKNNRQLKSASTSVWHLNCANKRLILN